MTTGRINQITTIKFGFPEGSPTLKDRNKRFIPKQIFPEEDSYLGLSKIRFFTPYLTESPESFQFPFDSLRCKYFFKAA